MMDRVMTELSYRWFKANGHQAEIEQERIKQRSKPFRPGCVRRGKFNNIPSWCKPKGSDVGLLFDSKAERNYGIFLDGEMKKGRIKSWRRQIPIDRHEPGGGKVSTYITDFEVTYPDGHIAERPRSPCLVLRDRADPRRRCMSPDMRRRSADATPPRPGPR
jgi:hypothetical protein